MSIIHESVYVAEGAIIRGNVTIKENASVWFNSVVRAEHGSITIGKNTNVQDNCVLHVDMGRDEIIGDNVTIGHGAIVHGCKVGDNTLIGMGSTILNDAVIGKNCVIGAGALVTEGTVIPDNSLVVGVPGVVKKTVTDEDAKKITENALAYVREAREYMEGLYDK